jgi:hypothetical protein
VQKKKNLPKTTGSPQSLNNMPTTHKDVKFALALAILNKRSFESVSSQHGSSQPAKRMQKGFLLRTEVLLSSVNSHALEEIDARTK